VVTRAFFTSRALHCAVVLGFITIGLTPAPAWAHGRLKRSVPEAGAHLAETPRQLRLEFSEAPELMFTTVRLLTRDGRDIPLAALTFAPDSRRAVIATVRGAMGAGTYTVLWQMAGDDGHAVRGRFEFVVAPGAIGAGVSPSGSLTAGAETSSSGAAAAASAAAMQDSMAGGVHHDPVSMPESNGFGADSPPYVVLRWLQYAALLLVIGAVSFRFLVLGFLRRDLLSQGEGAEPAFAADAEYRAARIGYVAAGVLGATLLLRLGAQSYAMHGASDAFNGGLVATMVARTIWGWGWLLELVGVLLAGLGYYRARGDARNVLWGESRVIGRERGLWWTVAALGALIAAFSPALSGHAASAPSMRAFAVLADGVHVLGASSWLGTLALVLLAGLPAVTRQVAEVRGPLVRSLINAYSPVALASAGVAATTGVFAAWLHVGTIPNLWSTRYGITLLVKLTVLGVVALTGFHNWRFVKPRLGTDAATVHLVRSARVEIAVAIIVLLVTAVLVASPTSMDMTM
jgi:copper transport protein